MGKKIICDSCETVFQEHIVKDMKICPVCGGIWEEDSQNDGRLDWITWYYYGFKNSSSATLTDKPVDLDKHGDIYYLIKEFKAPPRDKDGKSDAAKKELRKYIPDAFAETPPTPQTRCPRCFSTEIQLVPRKFSLITGFATNRFDRMCIRCQKRF